MSIDRYYWVPTGTRNNPDPEFRCASLGCQMTSPHQIFLAHQQLIDEQYFFEDSKDALWFFVEGWKVRMFLDQNDQPMAFDRMCLWLDGREHGTKGYGEHDGESQRQPNRRNL